jgi:anti-sigma factor RsiW
VIIGGASPHTLAGAYTLNALEDAERARFERHLARCDACVQEVGGLRETAALLGAAVAVRPPERLRESVLAAAERTRQIPPARQPGRVAGPEPGRTERAPRAERNGRLSARGLRIAVGAVAASLACVVVVLAVVAGTAQHRLADADRRNGDVAAVLTAHDAKMMTAHVTTGGTATIVMSHSKRMAVFSTAGLRVLPGAMGYELWLMGPTGARPAGMLPKPSHGMTAPMIASGIASGDKIGLTVEPNAGSARPTTPPVLMLTLPQ